MVEVSDMSFLSCLDVCISKSSETDDQVIRDNWHTFSCILDLKLEFLTFQPIQASRFLLFVCQYCAHRNRMIYISFDTSISISMNRKTSSVSTLIRNLNFVVVGNTLVEIWKFLELNWTIMFPLRRKNVWKLRISYIVLSYV